jgi:hypothetical protein
MLVSGAVSLTVLLMLIYFTDWDIYAVAGVSSLVTICKNLFFTVPIASKLLGYRWYRFYPQVGISTLCSVLIIAIGSIVRMVIPVSTWITFFLTCGIVGALGLSLNLMIVLNKEERGYFRAIVKRKLRF